MQEIKKLHLGGTWSVKVLGNVDAVRTSVGRSPRKSNKRRSQKHCIPQESLRRTLSQDLKLYSHKIQIKLKLTQGDWDKRVEMYRWFCQNIEVNPDFLKDVWFSDEVHFLLSGHVNKKNCVFWGQHHRKMCCSVQYLRKMHCVGGLAQAWNQWSISVSKQK